MATNPFELHPDRLTTTDEKGRRVYVYPADVKGKFRHRRVSMHFIFLCIFLSLPWLRWNGHQALFLNLENRHFDIFGLSLRAHNAPLIFFVLAAAGFGLFFVTSIWGRIWCGWACPQTVFVDFVYRRIERLVEGPALKRRQMAEGPWTFERSWKFVIKWSLYILASLIITHSFLAYFVGTDALREMITRAPADNWGSFLFILFSTAIILFDFAWFREQFCIIACPYGRFQSVLMDSGSMIVTYDPLRGEPRATPQAKVLAKNHGSKLGDCVNCYRCVQVCPTGIDIRRGTQMECIACTGCIDACDEVMEKVNKPKGLIRYDTLRGLQNKKTTIFRPRPIIYLTIAVVSLLSLYVSLYNLLPVDIEILRNKDVPYTLDTSKPEEKKVLNHFNINLRNQDSSVHQIRFDVLAEPKIDGMDFITPFQSINLNSDVTQKAQMFIRFPAQALDKGKRKVKIVVIDENTTNGQVIRTEKEVTLVGPL